MYNNSFYINGNLIKKMVLFFINTHTIMVPR